MLDNNQVKTFVDTLMRIPDISQTMPNGRDALLIGLPSVGLQRTPFQPRVDLDGIISGLDQLGRLDNKGGARPLIVVAQNAMSFVPTGSDVANALQEIIRSLEQYYGGEFQPLPVTMPSPNEEVVVGVDERVSYLFMRRGFEASDSVARLSVPRIFNGTRTSGAGYGTAWLIAPGLLLTNHHVIKARATGEPGPTPDDLKAQAEAVTARFDYYVEGEDGRFVECAGAALVANNETLDYALLRLNEAAKVANRTPLTLVKQQPTLSPGARTNIIQYPNGGALKYAIRHNFYTGAGGGSFIRYVTDTEPGASGSPVFNDDWQVVALHHAAVPTTVDPTTRTQTQTGTLMIAADTVAGSPQSRIFLNEGITIHSILDGLDPQLADEIGSAQGW